MCLSSVVARTPEGYGNVGFGLPLPSSVNRTHVSGGGVWSGTIAWLKDVGTDGEPRRKGGGLSGEVYRVCLVLFSRSESNWKQLFFN